MATVSNIGGVKVKLNHKTIGAMLDGDLGIAAELHSRAAKVLAQAKSTAPVDTGAYRDGLHIEEDHTDRLVVRIKGDTDHDWIVEAKTGNLARSIDAAGGS